MKREILFRAKNMAHNVWVEGNLVRFANGEYYIFSIGSNLASCNKWQVVPGTICQYTGLKDKNGIKIFDGDVVKLTFSGAVGEIVCDVNYLFCINAFGKTRNIPITDYSSEHIEVIGNIYDNVGLIEIIDAEKNKEEG